MRLLKNYCCLFIFACLFSCDKEVQHIHNIPISKTVEGVYSQTDASNKIYVDIVGENQVRVSNFEGNYLSTPIETTIKGHWEIDHAILYESEKEPFLSFILKHSGEVSLQLTQVETNSIETIQFEKE